MSRISPKLIDVERCRVGDEKFITIGTNISGVMGEDQFLRTGDDRKYKGMNKENIGRFPTQLYTNIKNDKFKYVKCIRLDSAKL